MKTRGVDLAVLRPAGGRGRRGTGRWGCLRPPTPMAIAAGRAVRHRHVPVELAVAADGLAGPGVRARPAEGGQAHRRAVVGPVDHVGRGPDPPVLHGEVGRAVFVVSGVEVDPAVVDQRGRVGGVDVLHDRVVGPGRGGVQRGGDHGERQQEAHHPGGCPGEPRAGGGRRPGGVIVTSGGRWAAGGLRAWATSLMCGSTSGRPGRRSPTERAGCRWPCRPGRRRGTGPRGRCGSSRRSRRSTSGCPGRCRAT